MTKLYSELARVYHEMYQSLFDYDQEYQFYDRLLRKYDRRSVLELGCGSGNLAPYFLEAGYDYVGLDLSNEMLQIAREVAPNAAFRQGDMRDVQLKRTFEALIITGRSLAYMITNQDVMGVLQSSYHALAPKGILIFDSFRAEDIILGSTTEFIQTAAYQNRKYRRVSHKSLNLETGWTWNWQAVYYLEEDGETEVVEDSSILRAFTESELRIFLALNGFTVLEVVAEDTFTSVAQRD